MTQAKIREQILDIVHGNIRYADPFDRMNLEKGEKVGVKGFTTQSAEEVLEDIIYSIRTANESVVEAKATGKATLQVENGNPGNFSFTLSISILF